MSISRRNFIRFGSHFGVAASASMLWSNNASALAFDTVAAGYKAVVLISMPGGNDCNSLLVPGKVADYAVFKAQRSGIALDFGTYNQIYDSSSDSVFGLHPSLANVATLYAQKRASIVANIGSLPRLATKAQVLASPGDFPAMSFSHAVGTQQWENGQVTSSAFTGWGGRVADTLTDKSGILPPVISAAGRSLFTIGAKVQAVSMQQGGAFVALPNDFSALLLQNAIRNTESENEYVKNAAALRRQSLEAQVLLGNAAASTTFKTPFPNGAFGNGMKNIAQIVGGHSNLSASRQIFYISQGNYDTHQSQVLNQALCLSELDAGLGAFFSALAEIGMSDDVLVCTHSDFGRSLQANNTGGTDHGWGGHQLVLGGGIRGGRIFGKLPQLLIGGPDDVTGNGGWIPTIGIPELTSAIAGWMGLSATQVANVLPDVANFPQGRITLS